MQETYFNGNFVALLSYFYSKHAEKVHPSANSLHFSVFFFSQIYKIEDKPDPKEVKKYFFYEIFHF